VEGMSFLRLKSNEKGWSLQRFIGDEFLEAQEQ